MIAPSHPYEPERLNALKQLEILDTPAEKSYDDLTRLAADICDVPIALVSLVDEQRQWFKSKVGLDGDETHRDYSFCAHCILDSGMMEVADATEDPRFRDNPLVTGDPNIRFYAGVPLMLRSGRPMGSLCVIAPERKVLNEFQKKALLTLSRQVSDLLELRIAHLELEKQHVELEKTHSSLKNLFQVIAHDLREPFNGLLGLTELLAKDYDSFTPEDVQDLLNTLNESSSETYVVLENLLEWSNFEAGELPFRQEDLGVSELVNDSVSILSTLLTQKGVELHNSIPEDELVFVDAAMIASVVRNLTSNALKFSQDGGSISISAAQHESGLLIEISDHGRGMSAEQIKAVLASGSSRSLVGTSGERGCGIGLMLVHQFLAKHGSKLEIESTLGTGTVVRFVLPTA